MREVEGEDGGVLEDESWFCWLEDYPDEEDCYQDDDDEADDHSAYYPGGSSSAVLLTVFGH